MRHRLLPHMGTKCIEHLKLGGAVAGYWGDGSLTEIFVKDGVDSATNKQDFIRLKEE